MSPRPDPTDPGQESVWSYPRPAIAEPSTARIVIAHRGVIVADTKASVRTLETSHPPSYYIPRADIAPGMLRRAAGSSFCEWKGAATYWDVVIGDAVLPCVGWSYVSPTPGFAALRDHIALYAAPFDRCSEAFASNQGEHTIHTHRRRLRRRCGDVSHFTIDGDVGPDLKRCLNAVLAQCDIENTSAQPLGQSRRFGVAVIIDACASASPLRCLAANPSPAMRIRLPRMRSPLQ